ncbi:hypothetical protein FHG87_018745 [Trinorchestia longiramus]|nr:hypothetical protein FHG87_018745 [Trinorchestia longiramus]
MAPVNEKEQEREKERDDSGTSTTNNLTNGDAAAATSTSTPTSTSSSSTAEPAAAKTVSSNSFLAAAAAEERQQQQLTGNASSGSNGNASSGSNAMLTAAGQGKIGQYNTLVKVLRELKTSEAKLTAHLATLQTSSGGGAPAATPAPAAAPAPPADVPNSQVCVCALVCSDVPCHFRPGLVTHTQVLSFAPGLVSRTQVLSLDLTVALSVQSIGQVSTRTVDAVDAVDRSTPSATPSFADRLAAGMEEANQLTTRLRDNVARREDLVERYRATRERLSALKRQRRDIQQQERSLLLVCLAVPPLHPCWGLLVLVVFVRGVVGVTRLRDNVARREDLVERYRATRERLSALKRQRRDIQQQERSLLLSQSSRDSPYDDPIPGASSWSLDELNAGLADFRSLYDKVATLNNAYDIKVQALEVGDAVGRAEISNKQEQLATKRTQLIAVITQLRRLRADKMREQGMDVDGDAEDFQPVPTAAASSPTAAASSLTAEVSLLTAEASSPTAAASSPTADVECSCLSTVSSPTSVATSSTSATVSSTSATVSSTSTTVSATPPTTIRSASASAADLSDLLPADPVSRNSGGGGGSVSIGTLPALVSAANVDEPADADDGVSGGVTESALSAVVTARAEMEAAGQELVLRTQHLNNLKEELASMKRLLDVTQRRVNDGGPSQDMLRYE